jgi:hypothetical protein
MIQLMLSFAKWTIFAIAIILLSNTLEWNGRTVSDQVKTTFAKAQSSQWLNEAQDFSRRFMNGQSKGQAPRSAPQSIPSEDEKRRLKELLAR